MARGRPLRVTLVSDTNFLLFTPMLAGAASGAVQARHISDPRVWLPSIRGALRSRRPLPGNLNGGILGLPADFLISTDNQVLARKYGGTHAYDQWSVDELLDRARG